MRVVRVAAVVTCLATLLVATTNGTELLVNGDLEGGFYPVPPHRIPTSWTLWETTPNPTENSLAFDVPMNGPSAPGTWSWEFFRDDFGFATGDWTSIEQALSISTVDWDSLTLSIDVMVDTHDLEGGGFVSPAFEWPAIVQIDYTDVTDTSQIWRFGWYLDPPGDFVQGAINDPGQGLIPIYNDMLVPPNVWVTSSFDLMVQLPQLKRIDKIRVGGSGWSFHSFIDNVSLSGVPRVIAVDATSWSRVKAQHR